jgi:Ca2+-binding RTX toxin-like protein
MTLTEQGGSVSHSITPLTWNWQYSLPTDVPKLWRIEAEAIAQRTGFELEVLGDASGGQALSLKGVPASQDGTATFQFNGVTGTYNLFLGSFDENDGAARFEVAKNGTSIGSITLDQLLGSATPEAQTRVRRQVGASFQLSKGDTLRIRGWQDKAEFARLDYVELVPNTSTQPSLQLNSVAGYSAPSAHLIGRESIDYLVGGIADNLLVGKMGNDVLTSGSNADQDIVLFSSIAERQDIIKDFDRVDSLLLGGDDRDSIQIVLAGFAATGNAHHLQQGILSDDRLVKGTDDLGLAAGFRYFELSGNLYFDSNGGSFDSGTGSLALAMLANKPRFDSLSGSITII